MTDRFLILETDIHILRSGGHDAIALFLNTSQRLHEAGLAEGMEEWIKLATSLLPQEERGQVMVLMMYGYLHMQYQKPDTHNKSLH